MRFLLSLLLISSTLSAQEHHDRQREREKRPDVSLTIYNQNLAQVSEIREVEMEKGIGRLRLKRVSDQIQPASVSLRSLSDPENFRVLEQTYDSRVINEKRALQRYIGREIELHSWNEFQDRKEEVRARLLSAEGGGIYEINDKLFLGHPGVKVLPKREGRKFNLRPALKALVHCPKEQTHKVELSYMTAGFDWKGDYQLHLGEGGRATLSSWATIHNGTKVHFHNAKLSLLAGEPNRATTSSVRMYKVAEMSADVSSEPSEESFAAYHLYKVERRTSLKPFQTKQIALLSSREVGVSSEYEIEGKHPLLTGKRSGDEKLPVTWKLLLSNSEEKGLGVPLPSGIVRFYQEDSEGKSLFVGEDRIAHTPIEEELRLTAGRAFDLVAQRRQLSYQKLSSKMHESEWELTLRNRKEEPATVTLFEKLYGSWKVVESSHEYESIDAQTIKFKLPLSSNEEVKVRYKIRVGL